MNETLQTINNIAFIIFLIMLAMAPIILVLSTVVIPACYFITCIKIVGICFLFGTIGSVITTDLM